MSKEAKPVKDGFVAIRTGKRGRPPVVKAELAEAVQALVDSGMSVKDALEQASA